MGWPPFPPLSRGLVTVAALLVPLIFAVALLPALIAWPFLSAGRQERLQSLLERLLEGTADILAQPAGSRRKRGA